MLTVLSLWLPIVVSAVAVYIASTLIHMVIGYHKNDVGAIPDERKVADAMRPFAIPPGDYVMPPRPREGDEHPRVHPEDQGGARWRS